MTPASTAAASAGERRIARRGPAGRRAAGAKVRSCLQGSLFAVVASAAIGCRTPARLPPLNLAEPGWQVRQGQAVWRARKHRPALAGELIVAWNRDGRCFAQFSKTPFTLLNVRLDASQWAIEFPPEHRSHGGTGEAPHRFAWLHLPNALAGRSLPVRLEMTRQADGGWRLFNRRTGEEIEGYLSP